MDYSIVAQYNANSNRVVIAFIIDSGNSWERIQISYFISGRPEFFLGTFISSKHQFSQTFSWMRLMLMDNLSLKRLT